MSTNDFGFDASGGESVLGSSDLLADFNHQVEVQGCGCAACQSFREAGTDGATTKGGINGSNPESGYIGQLLNLVTNPDGSRSFTGNRNVDADPDRLQVGHAEPDLQLPDLGLELQWHRLRQQRRQPLPSRPGHDAAGGGARGLRPDLGGHRPDLHRNHRDRHGPRQHPHLADRRQRRPVGLRRLPVRHARRRRRHLVRPHQPALLRPRRSRARGASPR